MGLPVGPCMFDSWGTFPLMPGQRHVAHARACLVPVVIIVLSESGKDLTFLLLPHVDGKGEARVNARMEVVMLSSRSGWLIWA